MIAAAPQPFRAGDVVEVLVGDCRGERWVVAVYEADRDIALIAGWPCTMVTRASVALRLHDRASDAQHAQMVDLVAAMGADPRRTALERVQASGGMP